MTQEKIYFVMPAYNEEANIRAVVEQWYPTVMRLRDQGADATLAIANDGSKDSTYAVLCELKTEYPHLEAIDKPNSGHGATVLYLYRHALAEPTTYFRPTATDRLIRPSLTSYGMPAPPTTCRSATATTVRTVSAEW